MPGGRRSQRQGVLSTYLRATEDPEEPSAEASTRVARTGRGRGRPRRQRREPTPPREPTPEETPEEAEDDDTSSSSDSDLGGGDAAGGSTSSGSAKVYLRGPSQLPRQPPLLGRRPVIRPSGDK